MRFSIISRFALWINCADRHHITQSDKHLRRESTFLDSPKGVLTKHPPPHTQAPVAGL
ncbi:hypothetical protein GGR93_001706 [Sulfitobacter noctilucicola]|uniref:Uncharacterized protein n=1 Tax=Sulfitobacter noctilucicola TaxID=1342301 RepID=A0A7W6Q3S7_9RHOB|nr:hypothetical protein [Sulfitobacter noctilucicola]